MLKAHRGIVYIGLVVLEAFHQVMEFCILLRRHAFMIPNERNYI